MSSTLKWMPLRSGEKSLSDELKFILREYFAHQAINVRLDGSHINVLEAIRAACRMDKKVISDCKTLIEAIEKYDTIVVEEVY